MNEYQLIATVDNVMAEHYGYAVQHIADYYEVLAFVTSEHKRVHGMEG